MRLNGTGLLALQRQARRGLWDCMTVLKVVSQFWGWDKIKHYGWVSRGLKCCKKLRAAAYKNPIWSDVSIKLSCLQLRRTQLPRGRSIRFAVDPLEPSDLVCLKDWDRTNPFIIGSDHEKKPLQFQKLTRAELPKYLGFDKFGLLVQQQFAVEDSDPSPTATSSDRATRDMSSSPDSIEEVVDEAVQHLNEHMATDSTPGDDAANQDEHSDDPSDTMENKRRDTAGPDASTRTYEAGVECDSAGDESEDDVQQPSTQYPSPGPSSTEKQPTRHCH
jgi:hypothetical protein